MNQPPATLLEKFFPAAKTEQDPEEFFVLNARKRRRLEKAAEARQLKKGRRAFVRRELAKERAASDLANLFALIDGQGPPIRPRIRAQQAINARIKYLLTEAPDGTTWDEIEKQLRQIAATATLVTPKVDRHRKALDESLERELVRSPAEALRTPTNLVAEALTTGRTGRAG